MTDNTKEINKKPINGCPVNQNEDIEYKSKLIDSLKLPKPIIKDSQNNFCEKSKQKNSCKKKRRDKSDLGDNFVAPDGGWGWLVSIACGVSKLVAFGLVQQFGIIFRDHMTQLGITNSELTTIINIQIATSAVIGLINGPLFRRFTFRQVSLFGSFLTFAGLFSIIFANSFILYCITFSCCYGLGRGLIVSSSSLALNTYFKVRRRTATAYHLGVAGLGPICLPYMATLFLDSYGIPGTVLLFAGISLNAVACSLVYQPVKWHVKKPTKDVEEAKVIEAGEIHDIDVHVIAQTIEPETPVLTRANDGWFGSKSSINSTALRNRLENRDNCQEGNTQMVELKLLNSKKESNPNTERSFSISHSIKEEQYEAEDKDYKNLKDSENKEQDHNLDKTQTELQLLMQREKEKHLEQVINEKDESSKNVPWYMKVVVFFDLDLLRDFTYINLSIGLTLINFVEINFAILTPFILSDFGFERQQIALAMSLLGASDLILRFLIPLLTAKMTLSNKAFFVWSVLGMSVGRMFLSFTRDFYGMLAIFIWMGVNKAFRNVFWGLIIPDSVPLKRLAAASGLQLLMSGLFTLACGPLIGLLRDNTNYAFVLNFLNALCVLAIAGWVLEAFVRKYRTKAVQ